MTIFFNIISKIPRQNDYFKLPSSKEDTSPLRTMDFKNFTQLSLFCLTNNKNHEQWSTTQTNFVRHGRNQVLILEYAHCL